MEKIHVIFVAGGENHSFFVERTKNSDGIYAQIDKILFDNFLLNGISVKSVNIYTEFYNKYVELTSYKVA